MSKQKKALVPELRFPEFMRSSGWNAVYGNKAFEQISNKDHNSDLPILAITQEYGAIPREMIDYKVSVTEKSVQSYKVVDVGDFIISLRSFQGGIEYSEYKGLCSPAYVILRNKTGIDKRFFKQYFKAKSFIRDLTKNLEGLRDGKVISYKQFSEVLLPKPSSEEQQKIADCLASIDELITLHTQKLDALRDNKKGLMQRFFPAEGETVPKLRFPEFKGKKESWVTLQLQDFSTIIRGASPRPKGNPRYYGGSVPRLMGQDVSRDGKWVTPCIDYLTDEGAKLSRFCKKGTLTIICSGDVGVPSFLAVDACIHDGFLALTKINSKVINKEFLYYCLVNLHSVFNDSATHGGIYINLTTSILKEFRVSIPESLEEQGSIVSVLAAVDDLIAAQDSYLSDLKNHKVGLVQKLFPVMDNAV